jgi:hypothetical protein
MSDENRFRELIHRVRAGDAEAAEELVRQYENLTHLSPASVSP